MKRVITVCLAVAMAVLLAACQSTPEQPVVVQKDMQQMIEKGMAGSTASQAKATSQEAEPTAASYAELCAHYGVPERHKASITEGNLTINCDVEIELPETEKLPMAKVEAGRFSQEQVYTLFNALCCDKQMYLIPEQAPKEYYENQILEYQRKLASVSDEKIIESLKKAIANSQKDYESALETVELVPADGTLKTREIQDDTNTISGSFTMFYASSAPFEENAMKFYVQNDPFYESDGVYTFLDEEGNTQIIAPWSRSRLEFEREGSYTSYGVGIRGRKLEDVTKLSVSGGTADGCMLNTTPQQARNTVETFMEQTGTDDMVIDSVSLYSSKQKIPPEIIEHWKQQGRYIEDTTPETQAYVFRLLRRVNGVNVESVERWSSQSNVDGMDVGKEWTYEMLSIAVDDKGIADLYWEAPLVVTDIITADTAIRPWSEIENIFEKMIVIQNEYAASSNTYSTVIDITRVSLTLRRIMERDSYTKGLLVPVWNFFGTETSQNDGDDPRVQEYDHLPLLTINAIDGSVIDIEKGY